jgi:integrase
LPVRTKPLARRTLPRRWDLRFQESALSAPVGGFTNCARFRNQHGSKRLRVDTGTDFVFPSMKGSGKVQICASVFCRVHLRPAAKKAGVVIPDGHGWGLDNVRHSLSNWLVNKAKENPKTVQGILGDSRIQTTLDLNADEDLNEMISAQEKFLDPVGFEKKTIP